MNDFLASTITGIINAAKNKVLVPLITLLIISATVIFIWGIIKYISAASDSKKIGEARQFMLWGIIGLFVIVAMWGLVKIIQTTFDIGTGSENTVPEPDNIP